MASVLRTGQGTMPETPRPAALLNARYEVVPFFEALRQRELEILDTWCREDHAASVRLLVGPGGTGTTRLLIHVSSTLRAAEPAWHAGFLPEGATAEDLDRLLADDRPTLIVVDYAESRPGLLDVLRRLAARPADARAPCRVVLLARDVGDWYPRKGAVDSSLQVNECFGLPPGSAGTGKLFRRPLLSLTPARKPQLQKRREESAPIPFAASKNGPARSRQRPPGTRVGRPPVSWLGLAQTVPPGGQ